MHYAISNNLIDLNKVFSRAKIKKLNLTKTTHY